MSRQPASVGGRADAADFRQDLLARLGLRTNASEQDIEAAHNALVEFLELAPSEVRSWATRQTADLDEAFALLSGPEQDLFPAAQLDASAPVALGRSAPTPSAAPDVPDAPATQWAPARPAASASTDATVNPLRKKLMLAGVPVVIAAVVAGVYFMGNSSEVPGFSGKATGQETAAAAAAPKATPVDPAKVASLTKRITANPKDKVSLLALGDIYFAAGDYQKASAWEQKVLGVDPKNQAALLAGGAAQFNLGNSAGAKKQWLVAAKLYPKNAEVHYDLGFLYMSQTPPDKANMQAEWKKVVDIDPNSNLAKTVAQHIKAPAPTASAAPSAK